MRLHWTQCTLAVLICHCACLALPTGFRQNGLVATVPGPTLAPLQRAQAVAVDSQGTLYIADSQGNRIWQMLATQTAPVLLAGSGAAGIQDGAGATARFSNPKGIDVWVRSARRIQVFVSDTDNHAIRVISINTTLPGQRTANVTTLCGGVATGFPKRVFGYQDGVPRFCSCAWLGPTSWWFSFRRSDGQREAELSSGHRARSDASARRAGGRFEQSRHSLHPLGPASCLLEPLSRAASLMCGCAVSRPAPRCRGFSARRRLSVSPQRGSGFALA
jgi:hypothetical protein